MDLIGEYEVAEFLDLLPGDYSDIEVPDQYEVTPSSSSSSSYSYGEGLVPASEIEQD